MGMGLDFRKSSKFMKPIVQGPFYALHYEYSVSAIISGLMINENCEVLDNNGQAIDSLYAVVNCFGPFCDCADYPLKIPGGSISRVVTFGYLTGKAAAQK